MRRRLPCLSCGRDYIYFIDRNTHKLQYDPSRGLPWLVAEVWSGKGADQENMP